MDNLDSLRGQRAYVELRKLIRRDSVYCQTSWFKLEKKWRVYKGGSNKILRLRALIWRKLLLLMSTVISAKQRKASLGKNLVMVYTEKVWLYLTSRQKLPTFWDLQEAEFLCFLSSQQLVRAYLTRAAPIIAKLLIFYACKQWCVSQSAVRRNDIMGSVS